MTSNQFPEAGSLVEVTTSDEPVGGVRVVQTDDAVVILSLALAVVPPEGAAVTLRWPAGLRGRFVQAGTVVDADENRVAVELIGEPGIEQQRNFVRGGGGEKVLLRRPGQSDATGWIRDISEQGTRAHFADVELHEGDDIVLRFLLDPDPVQVHGVASKVESLQQSIPRSGPMSVEVVAVFVADESQAQIIRRYVLRQQMLTRTRSALG
jgi:hypothetical protein